MRSLYLILLFLHLAKLLHCGGGVPVFVDVEEDSFNMSADSLGRRFVKSFMKRNWFQRRLLLSIFLDSRRIMTGSAKLQILTGCFCWKMARRDLADGLVRKEPAASEIFPRLHFFRQSRSDVTETVALYLQITMSGQS